MRDLQMGMKECIIGFIRPTFQIKKYLTVIYATSQLPKNKNIFSKLIRIYLEKFKKKKYVKEYKALIFTKIYCLRKGFVL